MHPFKGITMIGVTGGIASGKSTLLKYIGEYEYMESINLDKKVHEIYWTNKELVDKLVITFGEEIRMEKEGRYTINRKVLGEIVFNNYEKLHLLNELVHPVVKDSLGIELQRLMKEKNTDLVFCEGALIIEANWKSYFNFIWSIILPKDAAQHRIIERNPKITPDLANKIVKSQILNEERIKNSDFWYDSGNPFENNKELIKKELNKLKTEGLLRDIVQKVSQIGI